MKPQNFFKNPYSGHAPHLAKPFNMKKQVRLTLLFSFWIQIGFSQSDTTAHNAAPDIFNRITKSIKEFRLDTTAAPDDKITRKITELRKLRGGFNINEAIDFKLEEDRQKNEVSKAALDSLSHFFKSGNGKKWLDNAVTWIYRRHFTYSELQELVRFYRTPAGQKMATDFPVIMLQSLQAAELIRGVYTQQQANPVSGLQPSP